ncbi:MAG TPA: sigma-70 family RNA polymerase sigma factor [Verrucomicrobiales bacterium]|nr:sigma-70 family RNA polymerase sigma factor [Verrucomicrobiales bacterium]
MSPDEASHHLQNFAATRCERAFRKLAEGHAGLVYSTALRIVEGDATLAQDVVQTVFSSLARRPQVVRDGRALAAWLHRAAVGCAVDTVRGENRRRKREEISMHLTQPSSSGEPADLWEHASPVIDAAMDRLPEKDRQLLVLRFWQRQDLRAIGSGFGMTDNAVQKRISRALEKLRGILARRGIRGTAAAFSAAMLTAASSSPSSAAIAGISTSSLALANTAGAASTTLFTKIVAMTAKQKIALTSAAAVVAIGAPAWIQHQHVRRLQAELDSLRASNPVSAAKEVHRLQAEVARLTKEKAQSPGSPEVAATRTNNGRRAETARTSSGPSTSFVPVGSAPGMTGGGVSPGGGSGPTVDVLGFGGDSAVDSEHRPLTANGKVHWDHAQATGAPDTQSAGDIPTAWAPKNPRSGEQWLQLGYKKAVEIKEINIHETHNPGAVSKVAAIMPDGKEKVLWQGNAGRGGNEIIESSIPVPPGTTANQIKVYVDTNRVESWPEIDAVEMVGRDGSKQWASESSASSSYSENYGSGVGVRGYSLNALREAVPANALPAAR